MIISIGLLFKKTDFNKYVVTFSDILYRIVKRLSVHQVINLWNKEENIFKDNTPKASLNGDNLELLIIDVIKKTNNT